MLRARLILVLALGGMLAVLALKNCLPQPPPLRDASAAAQFDARAAKARLETILGDERPHPTDSNADDAVRGRIVASLRGMGLEPLVRDQLACNELYKARGVSCARVRNVIAMLGPPTGKALLLNAHYDSTPVGPAAGDDGIGVATLLEVASKLKRERLKRPVILLFNEGEELGLVGARAFLSDPLASRVDTLVNLEARGVEGPVNMFETSRPNGTPIGLFARAVDRPVANSLSTDVYRLMPNYTDVNSFSERGWITLNLAPIGNETRYHSAGDNLAALDPATLQHMGDQTLALTRALAAGTPRETAGDRMFMDVAGRALLSLPLMVGVALLIVLIAALAALGTRRGMIGRSLGIMTAAFVGSGAAAFLLLEAVGLVRSGMFWRAQPLWSHLAIYATASAVGLLLLVTLGARADVKQLRPASWLFACLVGAAIGLAAPGGIIFFLFPPLFAVLGMIASRWWRPAEWIGAALAITAFYLSWGEMLGLLEELMNAGPLWLFGPLGSLLILPVLVELKPVLDKAGRAPALAVSCAVALILWFAVLVAPAYSADRQQRFVIQHISDVAAGKSHWSILNDGAPLPPAIHSAAHWFRGKLPLAENSRWLAEAPREPSADAPVFEKLSDRRSGNQRTLTLRIHTNGNERVMLLGPEDARISAAGSGGFVRPIDQEAEGKYLIECFGRSCDGAQLQLVTGQTGPVTFFAVGSRGGLPSSALPLVNGRPRFARPQYARDEVIAYRRVRL